MIDFDAAGSAVTLLTSSWQPWLPVVPGLLIGLIFGAIPGLQISIAMAVFLPFTFGMDFLTAILFLTAIFTGGLFGGAIPAVLINIPGTAAAVATTFDGYPMARRGEHNEALGLALSASCVGNLIGYLALMLMIAPMADVVLKLGPSELLVVVFWGITLIAALTNDRFLRGMLAGTLGLILGTVGMSATGSIRGTMGIPDLLDGIPTVPAMIGLFAAAELFPLAGQTYLLKDAEARKLNFGRIWKGFCMLVKYPWILIRGSIIGVVIGVAPGVGAAVANLVSYSETKRRDPDPSSFGKGNPKGVVAAESADSSSEGGGLVTLLALGIPSGGGTAIMLAAFSIHNITGGPQFLRDHADTVYAIIFGNFVQSFLLAIVGLAFIHLLSSVVKVPIRFLIPSVLAMSTFGAFSLTGSMAGPVTVVVFGLIGWWMKGYGYPIAAFVVGLLLGKMAENELLRTYQISGGDLSYILERPVTFILLALLFASTALPYLMKRWRLKPIEA